MLNPISQRILENVERVLLGKTHAVKLCVAALIAEGHVLIEDVPGVGKTMLARALAVSIDATFKRLQFTPDLLPGDVAGVQIYNQETREFEFRPGPVVTNVLLADEINRGTPKTQSALLESMDEGRLSVDGVTYKLPDPFIVLATQNPNEFEGTFPLPESQLDRFLISLQLGYPDRTHELMMLATQEQAHPIENMEAVSSLDDLRLLQRTRRTIHVDDLVRDFILSLIESTRSSAEIQLGGSPRATIALFQMSQAWALVHGRDFVLPDDVKAVGPSVLRHRVVPSGHSNGFGTGDSVTRLILQRVPVPGNRG